MRNLERELASLARKGVKEIALAPRSKSITVTRRNLEKFLGRAGASVMAKLEALEDLVGVVTTGLAWTEVGGELLSIEAALWCRAKARMTVTGKLRRCHEASRSQAAESYSSRAVAASLSASEPPLFDRKDIHVHVPEGATPKDGPSAGVAMVDVHRVGLTGIPVARTSP